MKRSVRLLSLLATALLLLAACSTAEEADGTATEGGGAVATSEPADDTLVSEPALDETSEPAADTGDDTTSGQSLTDVAAENPQLTQLVQALEAAGMTSALEEAGPLTVFAPNNDAFAGLDQADLTELLTNPQQLGDILRYHVVEGAVNSSDLEDGQTLTTLEGSDLTVSVDGSTISVDGAEVVEPDIEAGNGVIHIIDGVIRPSS